MTNFIALISVIVLAIVIIIVVVATMSCDRIKHTKTHIVCVCHLANFGHILNYSELICPEHRKLLNAPILVLQKSWSYFFFESISFSILCAYNSLYLGLLAILTKSLFHCGKTKVMSTLLVALLHIHNTINACIDRSLDEFLCSSTKSVATFRMRIEKNAFASIFICLLYFDV